MSPPVNGTATVAPVFVDDSGRRRRWCRLCAAVVALGCIVYVAVVLVGLSQTGVGPLVSVPAGGNGLVAGFPAGDVAVPGLLTGPPATAAPTTAPTPRASAVRPTRTILPTRRPATPTRTG